MLQSMTPIAVLGALHYAPIVDLAWSPDGAFLAMASMDGYCRCNRSSHWLAGSSSAAHSACA